MHTCAGEGTHLCITLCVQGCVCACVHVQLRSCMRVAVHACLHTHTCAASLSPRSMSISTCWMGTHGCSAMTPLTSCHPTGSSGELGHLPSPGHGHTRVAQLVCMEGRRVPIPVPLSILIPSSSLCPFPSHPPLHPGCAHTCTGAVCVQGHTCWHRGHVCAGRHTFVSRGHTCCTVLELVPIPWVSLPSFLGVYPPRCPSQGVLKVSLSPQGCCAEAEAAGMCGAAPC